MDRHSKRARLTVCIAVVLAAATVSTSGQGASSGPRIKCATELFNFGYVPQDATVSHTYWLKNTGTEEVVITQIKPNCGCTRIPPSDSTIAVGDSLPIEMLFGSKHITGKVEKFTRIVANAEGRVPALTFQAQVFKPADPHGPIDASPATIDLGNSSTGKFTLRNTTRSALTVRIVDMPTGLIQLDRNELTLAPDESRELSFDLLPEEKPTEFTKSITIEASDPSQTRLTIPITNIKKE